MGHRVYVGNLSYHTTTESLKEAFSSSGQIVFARVMTDRETGQSRGFGFVEFGSDEWAAQAIADWNGADLDGRRLKVSIAEDKRPPVGSPGATSTFAAPSGRPVDVYQSRRSSATPRVMEVVSAAPARDGGRDGGRDRGRRRNDDDDRGGKWR